MRKVWSRCIKQKFALIDFPFFFLNFLGDHMKVSLSYSPLSSDPFAVLLFYPTFLLVLFLIPFATIAFNCFVFTDFIFFSFAQYI